MARFYSGVQIAVGGGGNAHAGVTGLLLADPFKGSLLQHPNSYVEDGTPSRPCATFLSQFKRRNPIMNKSRTPENDRPEIQTLLGAGGVIGNELMRELATRVDRVRLVRRHPAPPGPRMEARAPDLLDARQVAEVVEGSTVAYLVAGGSPPDCAGDLQLLGY